MHGRLENEVEDFIATLECEFDYDIINVSIQFIETKEDGEREKITHIFHQPDGDSSCGEL